MSVVIPMREISVVEKVETSALIPNAVHITTKSKVSTCQLVNEVLISSLNGSHKLLQLFLFSALQMNFLFASLRDRDYLTRLISDFLAKTPGPK